MTGRLELTEFGIFKNLLDMWNEIPIVPMKVDNNTIVYSKGDITFLSSQEPFDFVDAIEAVIGGSGL